MSDLDPDLVNESSIETIHSSEDDKDLLFPKEENISKDESISSRQESTRATLSIYLLMFLGATYLCTFILLFGIIYFPPKQSSDNVDSFTKLKDIITLLITTQTGLVGSALGFYFGSRNNE